MIVFTVYTKLILILILIGVLILILIGVLVTLVAKSVGGSWGSLCS